MHAHRSADAGAGWARTRGVVERELIGLHGAGDEPMAGTAETVVELLVNRARRLRLHDVKAEQAVAELEPMLERRDDLPVDVGADDERIDHRLDRVLFVFAELDVLAEVAR
jgi:hypothetical protein